MIEKLTRGEGGVSSKFVDFYNVNLKTLCGIIMDLAPSFPIPK